MKRIVFQRNKEKNKILGINSGKKILAAAQRHCHYLEVKEKRKEKNKSNVAGDIFASVMPN